MPSFWGSCGGSGRSAVDDRSRVSVHPVVALAREESVTVVVTQTSAISSPKTPRAPLLLLGSSSVIEERLAGCPFLALPEPKGPFPCESSPLNELESVEADLVRPQLSEAARAALSEEFAWRRFVRGYWTFSNRTKTIIKAAEAFAELRERYNLTSLSQNEPQARARCAELLECWRGIEFVGFDGYGHPVVIERCAAACHTMNQQSAAEIIESRVVALENIQALKCLATAKGEVEIIKHVYILDFGGTRLSMFNGRVRAALKDISLTLEECYPETVWTTYVVNAPGALIFIWKMVRRWLHPETAAKIKLLGCDARELRAQLEADNVHFDSIPLCCGGPAIGIPLVDVFSKGAAESAAEPGSPLAHLVATTTISVATSSSSSSLASSTASSRKTRTSPYNSPGSSSSKKTLRFDGEESNDNKITAPPPRLLQMTRSRATLLLFFLLAFTLLLATPHLSRLAATTTLSCTLPASIGVVVFTRRRRLVTHTGALRPVLLNRTYCI